MNTPTLRILLSLTVVASLFAFGCRPPVDRSDRARNSKPSAKAEAPPAPVGQKPVIRETVRSAMPHPTIPEAEEDAIEQARRQVVERLKSLKQPVRQEPPLTIVREQYVMKDSRVVRKPNEIEQSVIDKAGLEGPRVYVEYTVEISESQLRQLRMHDRLVDALRIVGVGFVLVLVAFLFLRADDWSRGYLTSWLGLLAAAGVLVGLYFLRSVGG